MSNSLLQSRPKNLLFLLFLFLFSTTFSYANSHSGADEILVFCQEQVNITLDTDGTAAIGPEQVATIIGDPASLDFITVTPNFFDCNDVGTNFLFTLTWSEAGIVNSCTGHILVEDKSTPLIACFSSLNIALDFDGTVELTSGLIVALAIDNCPLSYDISPVSVSCADIGSTISVTATATDAGGNSNVCTSSVFVEDKIAPTTICTSSLTIDLAGNPSISISPTAIDVGSFDNCGNVNLSLSPSIFTNADLGDNIVQLTATDDSGNSNFCITTVHVVNNVLSYCVSNGLSTSREFIKKIKFRAINNFSGDNGGYADFTSMEARVRRGRSYNIKLKPGFHGSRRRQFWRVWIDWNQNQVFEASEKVAQGRSKFNIIRSIDVPATAIPGTTRMRVMMKRGGYGNPCAVFAKGEVEDYSVYVRPIAAALISQESPTQEVERDESMVKMTKNTDLNLFPNPVSDVIKIETDQILKGQLKIYNSLGELVYEQALNQTFKGIIEVPTARFISGTYTLLIQSEEGRKAYDFVVVK